MKHDEQEEQENKAVYQFINYVNKAIRHNLRDFDVDWRKKRIEFLPEDGDVSDAPSVTVWLACPDEQEIFKFRRSDGLGETMKIHHADLAFAISDLTTSQQDTVIKLFQEEMPMSDYAAEEGISNSTAYRRRKEILDRLMKDMERRMNGNEDESKDE